MKSISSTSKITPPPQLLLLNSTINHHSHQNLLSHPPVHHPHHRSTSISLHSKNLSHEGRVSYKSYSSNRPSKPIWPTNPTQSNPTHWPPQASAVVRTTKMIRRMTQILPTTT
ncbi:hypothetical protein PGTUg99_014386 [Puccinia graminis f. sp. tritici]|uniref:Uncharacterized protein n=1 Tax=Puccinia graminis f. sp. tritici TaxID=56615 RepID=A0A5B0M1V5_PUCGR|nr:hypothetical protein PGTUg99_014386 [Puccinia graminis f. sp. tritici]